MTRPLLASVPLDIQRLRQHSRIGVSIGADADESDADDDAKTIPYVMRFGPAGALSTLLVGAVVAGGLSTLGVAFMGETVAKLDPPPPPPARATPLTLPRAPAFPSNCCTLTAHYSPHVAFFVLRQAPPPAPPSPPSPPSPPHPPGHPPLPPKPPSPPPQPSPPPFPPASPSPPPMPPSLPPLPNQPPKHVDPFKKTNIKRGYDPILWEHADSRAHRCTTHVTIYRNTTRNGVTITDTGLEFDTDKAVGSHNIVYGIHPCTHAAPIPPVKATPVPF